MIRTDRAFSFSEIGKKDNQEDRVYPDPSMIKEGQRYFILCDGMGGHDSGEVASATVSSALGAYFDSHKVEHADKAYFEQALAYAYEQLDHKDTGAEKKMGTTLTCLLFNDEGFLCAHIGDSRIYQVRDGSIVHVTRDHSLVNDLIKAGELTEEEAKTFSHKNIITRAMQPNTKRFKAEIFESDDIKAGDYFFMCCDGVLERIDDSLLCNILSSDISDKEKIAAIKAECNKGTKDNYTCWLIPISEVKTPAMRDDNPTPAVAARKATRITSFVGMALMLLIGFVLGRLSCNLTACPQPVPHVVPEPEVEVANDQSCCDSADVCSCCDSCKVQADTLSLAMDFVDVAAADAEIEQTAK